mgnify:CR=1 FL=1
MTPSTDLRANGFSALKKYGPLALIGAGLGTGALALDLPPWLIAWGDKWGPGFLMIFGVFAGVMYYVPRGVVKDFVSAQQDQAVALGGIKDQLSVIAGQNGQLNDIKDMLSDIHTTQSVHGDRLKTIETRLGDGRRADDT